MALSQISGTTGIANATITSIKLADFAAAVDLNGVELILDADQDTSITADTDDRIDFKIAGAEHISLSNSSGDTIIKPMADGKDIVFQQYDARKILEINDAGFVSLGNGGTGPGELRIYEDTDLGTNYSGFTVGNLTESYSLALPNADGSSGQALTTDGSGVLSFTTVSANTPSSADGQALGSAALEWSDLFLADASTIQFGADQDVTLTHVADTGLLLNSTMKLQFNDASQFIHAPSATVLDIAATDEIELTATLIDVVGNLAVSGTLAQADAITMATNKKIIFRDAAIHISSTADGDLSIAADDEIDITSTLIDINGNVEISGTLAQVGVATFTARDIHSGGITIANDGTIGSVGDADSIAISSAGVVTMTQIPVLSAGLNVSGGTIAGTIATATQNSITTATGLVSVGALDSGSITSGFTSIDVGAGAITTTGTGTIGNLVVDDVAVDGKVITMTGSSGDTFVTTVAANGATSLVTTDAAAAAANFSITADGTVDIDSAGVLTLDSGAAINIEPASGSAILLDGTISIDAGVVTGATSVTSTAFVGNLTGTVATVTQNSITTMTGLTTVGANNTASSIAGITFFTGNTGSIFTHDVSATDSGAEYNTGYGLTALDAITTGDGNVAIGYGALGADTTAAGNVAVGKNALSTTTGGSSNTAVGLDALKVNTASNNTGVGNAVMIANTGGTGNVAMGHSALVANTTGNYNIAIGMYALDANDTTHNNTAVGYEALSANTASGNTAFGYQAAESTTTGAGNIAIGPNAMHANTTGARNIAIGTNAYDASDTENDNMAIGDGAMTANTAGGTENVAIGNYAMDAHTSGDQNTAVGMNAMGGNTSGGNNTAVGRASLFVNSTGSDNTAVGRNALNQNTTATDNTAVGSSALDANTTGADNVAVGRSAAPAQTTANHNVAVGSRALYSNVTAIDNVAVGYKSLYTLNDASGGDDAFGNTAVGHQSGMDLTTGNSNTMTGYSAAQQITTGTGNAVFGRDAGSFGVNLTTGSNNTFLGAYAHSTAVDSNYAIALGYNVAAADNDFSFGRLNNVVSNDFDADADWSRASDERIKDNIESTEVGLDFINLLRPVKFNFKDSSTIPEIMTSEYNAVNQKNTEYVSHGFIAQEVKAALDSAGDSSFGVWHLDKSDGETQRIKKNMLIMPLVKAVQELSAKVDSLQEYSSVLEQEAGYHLDNIILDGTNGSSANAGDDVLLG